MPAARYSHFKGNLNAHEIQTTPMRVAGGTMIISDQIKLGRKKLGMSQSELADTIWVSRNTISNWENGGRENALQPSVPAPIR